MDKGARNTMNSRSKILAAIAECDRLIAKEAARAADLRPAHVQQMVDHAVAHRAKLQVMLAA